MISKRGFYSALLLASVFLHANRSIAGDVVALIGADVPPYHESINGFREIASHEIAETYDMKGDFERAANILSTLKTETQPDLIFAVGLWALQAVIDADINIPVVYAMVLNPPSLINAKSTRVTGASMNVPVRDTLELIRELDPKLKRIGTLFSRQNTGFLIESAKLLAADSGFEIVAKEITSTKEAVSALQAFENENIDALWIIPDKLILARDFVEEMMLFCYRNRIPSIGFSASQIEMGALLVLSFESSEDIGRQAGELANKFLSAPSDQPPPFTSARKTSLSINLKTAEKLGIILPDSLLKRAHKLIE